jgi:hypothetical protein
VIDLQVDSSLTARIVEELLFVYAPSKFVVTARFVKKWQAGRQAS